MINAITIDDEPKAIEVIKHHASKIEELNLIECFNMPEKALNFLKQNPVDLIFLDINMPEITGLELLQQLNSEHNIIFTTAYSEYAVESYELKAVDYLMKPINFERFNRSIERYKQLNCSNNQRDFFFVKDGYKNVKIHYDSILYIKGCGNYLEIVCSDKTHTPRLTFKDIVQLLPSNNFIRSHNSYVINISQIDKIENNHIYIENSMIPIGSNFKQNLFSILKI